jgi:UDP-N-acetylglucosamine kinase
MNDEESRIEREGFEWIKKNKSDLFKSFADLATYSSDDLPTTIFMAGSPGAGKTEVSRRLAEIFSQKPMIIDADEIRKVIPGYNGKNAYLFQKAANKGVNLLYDYARKNNLNVIMDGTFAYNDALGNVELSLKHNRNVEIYFLYQDPLLSWSFTKERELKERRNVPKNVFINAYIRSIENVNKVKQELGPKIKLNLIIKDFEKGFNSLELNAGALESFLPKVYTVDELEELLQ